MERRHDELLTARLEDAVLHGCSHITWPEIYRWYGIQKIAARTYRDLIKRWEEVNEGAGGQMMMIKGRDGIFVFDSDKATPVDQDGE